MFQRKIALCRAEFRRKNRSMAAAKASSLSLRDVVARMQTVVAEQSDWAAGEPGADEDAVAAHMCQMLRVALSSLRGGQALQFTALLLVNKLIDLGVARGLALRPSRGRPAGRCSAHRLSTLWNQSSSLKENFQPLPSVFPWKVPKAPDPPPGRWWWAWRSGGRDPAADAEPPSHASRPTFLGILADEGVDFLLNMLNNAITLHKRVVGTRHHCTPSHRCACMFLEQPAPVFSCSLTVYATSVVLSGNGVRN
ncbi:hypothetical protein HPB48_014126 [Haemaphysalis longicornis]|uniref:Uncharacterized protein n=1 Tax=Haemaphysalis longicornis TaxID=44386 RepID=A0A9J6FM73_HAELO|nr:hypothetical protein HPB48_014126 [Haemaphysalis longicornis]